MVEKNNIDEMAKINVLVDHNCLDWIVRAYPNAITN
jgi:hypothetical protein